jgi:SAM-dependent methyltransferase
MSTRYDRIGRDYSRLRREDPRLARPILAALGDARSVVNVGAGAGSYEPCDRHVIAVEPSAVMSAQRHGRVPAIRASAGALPLHDDSVDAAMAVLTVHHWDDEQRAGIAELRRVARGPVVIMTFDPTVSARMWLMDYLPEVAALDHRIFPAPAKLARWLGGRVDIRVLPVPRDCSDRMLGAFWAHPEWVLDPASRAATSGFARQPRPVVERVVAAVADDLRTGRWHARHGHLLEHQASDVGLRLVVAWP